MMQASKRYINTCLSFVYARYTYRDTDLLEDKHASGEKLDMKFYESIVDPSTLFNNYMAANMALCNTEVLKLLQLTPNRIN